MSIPSKPVKESAFKNPFPDYPTEPNDIVEKFAVAQVSVIEICQILYTLSHIYIQATKRRQPLSHLSYIYLHSMSIAKHIYMSPEDQHCRGA